MMNPIRSRSLASLTIVTSWIVLAACSGDDSTNPVTDSDAGTDAKAQDGASHDSSLPHVDSGADTNVADANVADTNVADTNVADANVADTNVADTNVADANVADANVADANVGDHASPDAADANSADASDAASRDAGDAGTDAGLLVDSGSGDADAGACNTITQLGTVIHKTANAGAPPLETGGAIVDGTYVLTAIIAYNTTTPGSTANTETEIFSNNTVQVVTNVDGVISHDTATSVTLASQYTLNITCPAVGTVTGTYTSNATGFQRQQANSNEVWFYTKQ